MNEPENTREIRLNRGGVFYTTKLPISEIEVVEELKKCSKKPLIVHSKNYTIERIKIEGLNCTKIPDTLSSLINLESLEMRQKTSYHSDPPVFLDSLPETIGKLDKLQYLIIYNCKLKTLPKTIGGLTKLKTLNLSNNKLKSLPDTIGNLEDLSFLVINQNLLSTIPETVTNLVNLQHLEIQLNKITMLPKNLSGLSKLTYLNLGNNLIQELPDTFNKLVNLQYLNLSKNPLEKIPEILAELPNLEDLRIDFSIDKIFESNLMFAYINGTLENEDIVRFLTKLREESIELFTEKSKGIIEKINFQDDFRVRIYVVKQGKIWMKFPESRDIFLEKITETTAFGELCLEAASNCEEWVNPVVEGLLTSNIENNYLEGLNVLKMALKKYGVYENPFDFLDIDKMLGDRLLEFSYKPTRLICEILNLLVDEYLTVDLWVGVKKLYRNISAFRENNPDVLDSFTYRLECKICGTKSIDDGGNYDISNYVLCDFCSEWVCCGYVEGRERSEEEEEYRTICMFCFPRNFSLKLSPNSEDQNWRIITDRLEQRHIKIKIEEDEEKIAYRAFEHLTDKEIDKCSPEFEIINLVDPSQYWRNFQGEGCTRCGIGCESIDGSLGECCICRGYRRDDLCYACEVRADGRCISCETHCDELDDNQCCKCKRKDERNMCYECKKQMNL